MTSEHLNDLSPEQLADISGGNAWDYAMGGLRTLYRGTVKNITAAAGGWQLANQMYGTKEHGASWGEKWRARGAMMEYLDSTDKLPSWAPNW